MKDIVSPNAEYYGDFGFSVAVGLEKSLLAHLAKLLK